MVQAFFIFHISVHNGNEPEGDKYKKVAVDLVGRALNKWYCGPKNEILSRRWLLKDEKSPFLVIMDVFKAWWFAENFVSVTGNFFFVNFRLTQNSPSYGQVWILYFSDEEFPNKCEYLLKLVLHLELSGTIITELHKSPENLRLKVFSGIDWERLSNWDFLSFFQAGG